MSATAFLSLQDVGPELTEGENPWVSDPVLLSLSVWWVKMTRPRTQDFSDDVREVFNSLQRDLRQPGRV